MKEHEAELLEATFIDYIGIKNLTNCVRGLHSRSFGRTKIDDIIIEYKAETVEVESKVLPFRINKYYYSGIPPEELYEITRGIWKINIERCSAVDFAFAVFKGIVREVYQVDGWHKAGTLQYKHRDTAEFKENGRFEFYGKLAEEPFRSKYLYKSVRHLFPEKAQSPFLYVNC